MDQEIAENTPSADLVRLMELCGPPPILSSESLEAYNGLKDQLLACLHPEDAVVTIFVKDFLNFEWEVLRLLRHKAMIPERRFRDRQKFQHTRDQIMAAQRKRANIPEAGVERLERLESAADGAFDDVTQIFNAAASERDHALGLEAGIQYYEQLDKRLQVAMTLRNDSLNQIREYRADLGQNLQRVAEEVEAAAVVEVPGVEADKSDEASLVPSTDQTP